MIIKSAREMIRRKSTRDGGVKMYPLLDHDDFAKSRKALMATAAFLLLINHLQIVGDSVTVSGLTLRVDRSAVIGFGSLFLAYFSYVFIVRALEQYFSTRVAEVHQDLLQLMEEVKQFYGERALIGKEEEFRGRASARMSDINRISRFIRISVMLGLEVAPPILFAVYTVYAVGAGAAISSFLRLV
ncbi:hypothetical protein [Neorhizobium petrolearium]|uniref:ABC transmembrane type-1 domain-containing protein n=1 Tax=Neorhizobium petrolearium TaxID=515361 RepID=A0ABY8M607_9HYPH|nr:hypothetical protein [Neorhizobium petrolearium]MCC2608845.1 hypothetical protein [Neorhizobium petrolearium]WGI69094.1 hypothetical protein QEO92_03105 [Neorhizobium petrolearium]